MRFRLVEGVEFIEGQEQGLLTQEGQEAGEISVNQVIRVTGESLLLRDEQIELALLLETNYWRTARVISRPSHHRKRSMVVLVRPCRSR
jgi:hypothetical protein